MKISVFAASSSKIDQIYYDHASTLGELISTEGWEIIFGGGGIGLMGALSDSALKNGGKVTGVIPGFMKANGWDHEGITNMIVTPTMSERKQKIFDISDAVIALPGGIGTLEEVTEAITLKQLGLFKGAIIILNTQGFYEHFLALLDQFISLNFMRNLHKGIWEVASTPAEAITLIKNYDGWIENPQKIARI